MDLRTAVEQGILEPIRCVRVKTDIDLSDVRIHGIKYDAQDLARLLKEAGVNAEGISGSIKVSERNSIL